MVMTNPRPTLAARAEQLLAMPWNAELEIAPIMRELLAERKSLTSALKTLEQEIREMWAPRDPDTITGLFVSVSAVKRWADTLTALSGTTGPEK